MKAEDRVRRCNQYQRIVARYKCDAEAEAASSGEAEGYGPYKPVPPPKPPQQEVPTKGGPTPPPYRMPPLPMVQQQFQQQHPGPNQEGHQVAVDVEGLLPGAPESSPPLHTHSSKFPIEREVIVSSAEKTSDTFKAKIPLIQDYGKRLVGVQSSGVTGGNVGVVRGGIGGTGMAAVAPDAPIKQMAWTEAAGKAGRKVTPISQQQHHHHHQHQAKGPPNTHVHGGSYGQQFQTHDSGLHNRQLRDPMTSHHYNGQQMGAIPRREWTNSPLAGEDGGPHRNHSEYMQSHQKPVRNDTGITWSVPNAVQGGAYSNMQCNSGISKLDTAQEDVKSECVINSGACQKDEAEVITEQHHNARSDFDVEANSAENEKPLGRLSNLPSSKAFPTRTYHHIKDMISSRFGGGSKVPREGGVAMGGGDAESPSISMAMRGKESKEEVSRQGLNNSGCRSIPNINEASSSRMPCVQQQQQQPSNRKSNNLSEREEAQPPRMEGHYQQAQQFRKNDNNSESRGESASLGGHGVGKEQCVDQPHGPLRRDAVQPKAFPRGAMVPTSMGDDYGPIGVQKNSRREEVGRHEMAEKDLAVQQKGGMKGQHPMHASQDKRREDSEDSVLRESMQLEFSMGSMGIGEPAFYSTPVGEQGKQNNSKFNNPYALNGGEGDSSIMGPQHSRQQGHGSAHPGYKGNSAHIPSQGFHSNLNRASGVKGKGMEGVAEEEKGRTQSTGCDGVAEARGVAQEGVVGPKGAGGEDVVEGREVGGGRQQAGCFLYQETTSMATEMGSVGGGSSDYEKTTHRSGRSTSTDSGRGTAGHGMAGSRKGTPHEASEGEKKRDRMGGPESDQTQLDIVQDSNVIHPGSHGMLYGHSGQNSAHDPEWVDVVESELQQILDPKLHVMDGSYGMLPGVAHSVVSESMSMTPPLPPLSPGGSPPTSPICARKDRGKHYKLSSSMPYINKSSGPMEHKHQGSSHMLQGSQPHHTMAQGKGAGSSSRLYQATSHSGGIAMSSKGHGRQQERSGGVGGRVQGEGGAGGGRGWAWGGSGRASTKGSMPPSFGDRARAAMRKDQQHHGPSGLKAMLGNTIPLASFGAPPGFDNGDLTSTTTGLDLDSMLDGPTENTSEEDMSATIDTTDAHAIRKQLEGLENMYSEVLKLLGVKKHGSRYQPSDPRINKRRMYGSLSSLPSSASSRPIRDKRRQEDRKKVKDIKGINKRFQRLESHVVTLARSVAHLSSEMRTQHLMMQEIETMRGEIAQLRAHPHRSASVPWLTAKAPIEKDSFCNNVPALTNPDRVKKLTKFFGDEPPLLRIFLKKLGYEKYASAFEHERIGLVELPYLTEERLQKMGIPMGPRLRILQEAQLSFCQENMSVYVV